MAEFNFPNVIDIVLLNHIITNVKADKKGQFSCSLTHREPNTPWHTVGGTLKEIYFKAFYKKHSINYPVRETEAKILSIIEEIYLDNGAYAIQEKESKNMLYVGYNTALSERTSNFINIENKQGKILAQFKTSDRVELFVYILKNCKL